MATKKRDHNKHLHVNPMDGGSPLRKGALKSAVKLMKVLRMLLEEAQQISPEYHGMLAFTRKTALNPSSNRFAAVQLFLQRFFTLIFSWFYFKFICAIMIRDIGKI